MYLSTTQRRNGTILRNHLGLSCGAKLLTGGALAFILWLSVLPAGAAAAAVQVGAITPDSAARSSLVNITGAGFGDAKGASSVVIGGVAAWTSNWTDTKVAAYVPETTPVGVASVQVVVDGVASAPKTINVEARPVAQAGVAWRFRTEANYISHRAAVGADGTVYVNDSSGFLYALTTDGALKWVYDASADGGGSQGPTVIGADGTIYFGVAGINSSIHAVNPNGTRKWRFVDPGSQGPIAGPGVGPDGNIYAAFDLDSARGAVSLTPAGALRWSNRGAPTVAEYGQVGKEIVFGSGQMYVVSTYFGDLWAFELSGGNQRFHADLSRPGQPAMGPDGTVYVPTGIEPRLNAYSPSGQFLWAFFGDEPGVTNVLSAPDVGPEGTIYIERNLFQLYALSPAPSPKWIHQKEMLATGPVPGPIVSPTNELVLLGGQETYGKPGRIEGYDTASGQEQFQIDLPFDPDGTCPVPYARPRFTPSGDRAYIPAVPLCVSPPDPYSWLYAIDVAEVPPPVDTVAIQTAKYFAVTKALKVVATSTDPTATLQVFATATDELIGTLKNMGGGQYRKTFSWPTNPQNITVKSSSGGSDSKRVTPA